MSDTDFKGEDKLKHLIACFILSAINPWLAVGCAITKEWCDSNTSGNHWCWWDLLADTIGITIGTMVYCLLSKVL